MATNATLIRKWDAANTDSKKAQIFNQLRNKDGMTFKEIREVLGKGRGWANREWRRLEDLGLVTDKQPTRGRPRGSGNGSAPAKATKAPAKRGSAAKAPAAKKAPAARKTGAAAKKAAPAKKAPARRRGNAVAAHEDPFAEESTSTRTRRPAARRATKS